LFQEAFEDNNGRLAMMDRLTEVFIIHLLRHTMDAEIVEAGMLSGLAHPQLSKAIIAMHNAPEKNWPLEALAELSAMSRSKFSELFKDQVGQPPGDYLLEWRVALAQNLLKKGKPVGWVANKVGYKNASALARVFRKKTGQSPKQWLSATSEADPA
jgi:transcriptional regulator GlxA family with amidase domain